MNTNDSNTCTHRMCYKCKEVKELTPENFHRSKNRQLGFEYKCRECAKVRTWKPRVRRVLTEAQKQRKKELGRRYSKTLKYKIIQVLHAYERFDKKRNYHFNLTKEDMELALSSACAYCGFPSTGMDRIDNSLGHAKENCVPACMHCNVARMDNFTYEEMLVIGKAIREVKLLRLANEGNKDVLQEHNM